MPWTFEPADTTLSGFSTPGNPTSNPVPVTTGDPAAHYAEILATVAAENASVSNSGGGSYSRPTRTSKPLKWSNNLNVANAPGWWLGKTPSKTTGGAGVAATINALIPYMSVEDQQNVASYLSTTFPKWFGEYGNITRQAGETKMSTNTRDWFTSSSRAKEAMGTLQQLAKSAGKKESAMGAGYTFLKNYLNLLSQYGGDDINRQTRKEYLEMSNALSSLISSASGTEAESFTSIAQLLSNPTFTMAGNVTQAGQDTTTGNYYFGSPNVGYY